jgi:hypothetical protein
VKTREYKDVIRSAVDANAKSVKELEEAATRLLPEDEAQEVKNALGAAKVLGVVLGNIQFDAEQA